MDSLPPPFLLVTWPAPGSLNPVHDSQFLQRGFLQTDKNSQSDVFSPMKQAQKSDLPKITKQLNEWQLDNKNTALWAPCPGLPCHPGVAHNVNSVL